jgi:hypothetical protein
MVYTKYLPHPFTKMMNRFSRVPSGRKPPSKQFIAKKTANFELSLRTQIFSGLLNAPNHGIESCSQIPRESITEIILSNYPISSFFGFPPLPTLTRLEMNGTSISDFRSFPILKSIEVISLKETPVMTHPQARTALIILCPHTLRIINVEAVIAYERKFAEMYPNECNAMIRRGWMPTVPIPKKEEIQRINRMRRERETVASQKVATLAPALKFPLGVKSLTQVMNEEEEEQRRKITALQAQIENLLQDGQSQKTSGSMEV